MVASIQFEKITPFYNAAVKYPRNCFGMRSGVVWLFGLVFSSNRCPPGLYTEVPLRNASDLYSIPKSSQ